MLRKRTFKRICLGFALMFLLVYVGRTIYDFRNISQGVSTRYMTTNNLSLRDGDAAKSVKNYASEKTEYTDGGMQSYDQKYEKYATVSANTLKYTEDEEKLYSIVEVKMF